MPLPQQQTDERARTALTQPTKHHILCADDVNLSSHQGMHPSTRFPQTFDLPIHLLRGIPRVDVEPLGDVHYFLCTTMRRPGSRFNNSVSATQWQLFDTQTQLMGTQLGLLRDYEELRRDFLAEKRQALQLADAYTSELLSPP